LVNPEWFSRFRGAANSDMTEEYIETVSERYIELYEKLGEVRESRHFKYQ
jgi:GH35 family endo-1,4-beta-xylanase